MKTFILLFTISPSATYAFSQTITSTTIGGNWSEWTTWLGGVVPIASDNVIVNGPVRLLNYDNKCNNLTINSGEKLWSGIGWHGNLTVYGNILTNGTVDGALDVSSAGNIENNCLWIEGATGVPNVLFVGSNERQCG